MPSGFTSTSAGAMGARRTSAAFGGKASVERPWKDRDQSTWDGEEDSSRRRGASSRPSVRLDIEG
jgi:hypothetical protein